MKGVLNDPAGPRLCFVGSMVGRNPGHITQQGQVLADLFARQGYNVKSVSAFLNRYRRLADIVTTLVRQRHQTDVLIIEVYGGRSFVVEDIASWLGACFELPIVLWLHGGALPEFMDRFPRWSTRILRRADLVVAPSKFLARAAARFGFQAEVIPNVIDLPAYCHRRRDSVEPRLFWMRSFDDLWNPEMALRVLTRVRESFPDASLVMAGPDKGSQADVERLARGLGLREYVRFPGFLDMEGKARVGNDADIFINTNRVDNAPVAIIEACAMGLPIVTTCVGGIPDLLTDGETALLVADNDDEAMAQAVRDLVDNRQLAERLSRNSRLLAGRFSWDQVRPQWEKLFARLTAREFAPATQKEPENHGAKPAMMETF